MDAPLPRSHSRRDLRARALAPLTSQRPVGYVAGVITGLNHLTLAVRELPRAFDFYCDVLGMAPAARWDRGAYLRAGDLWLCLSVDAATRGSALPEYTHAALAVSAADFAAAAARVRASGAVIWRENRSEGDSLYFLDPDGHKLELHAGDLASRLAACRARPYAGMEFFDPPG